MHLRRPALHPGRRRVPVRWRQPDQCDHGRMCIWLPPPALRGRSARLRMQSAICRRQNGFCARCCALRRGRPSRNLRSRCTARSQWSPTRPRAFWLRSSDKPPSRADWRSACTIRARSYGAHRETRRFQCRGRGATARRAGLRLRFCRRRCMFGSPRSVAGR